MSGFENLYFAFPWLLIALIFLPFLWWILKVLPPKPKKHGFGGAFFLKNLNTSEKSSQTTPWWLLALRIFAILCFILAFASPQKKITHYQEQDMPLLIIIDNDWASAQEWNKIQEQARLLIEENMNFKAGIEIITTGASLTSLPPLTFEKTRKQALEAVNSFAPEAIEADYTKITAFLQQEQIPKESTVFYLNNSHITTKELELLTYLDNEMALTLFENENPNLPLYWFTKKQNNLSVQRLNASHESDAIHIHVKDKHNNLIASFSKTFETGSSYIEIDFKDIPNEIIREMALLTIEGQKHAGAHYWQKTNRTSKNIGIISASSLDDVKNDDYLNPYLYLEKALAPYHYVNLGSLASLIDKNDVLILTDTTQLSQDDLPQIMAFVENGGIFIRFADSYLAKGDLNDLSPVKLRKADREFESVLSWQTPQKLKAFPNNSPFSYLEIPDDITVSKQIVATPSLDLLEHSLALLQDGTPLITAAKNNQGWLVLFHVSATPEWSTLPISGLFLKQLRILCDLSSTHTNTSFAANTTIKLKEQINAFGDLVPATGNEAPLTLPLADTFTPNARTPIGIYINSQTTENINLGDHLKIHSSVIEKDVRNNFNFEPYTKELNINYKPYLLMAACLLFLCDLLYIALFNRGLIAVALVSILTISTSNIAFAKNDSARVTSASYLGYIKTGDSYLDRLSQKGLETLIEETKLRTSADLAGVSAIDLMQDSLQPYPLIYWPISATPNAYPPVLPRQTIEKIQHYFDKGGILLIDTRDQYNIDEQDNAMAYGTNTQIMKRLFYHMQTPPMDQLPDDHVLTRSFYLLSGVPGLYNTGSLWLAVTQHSKNDGVTPLIIGGNDWISAWARNDKNIPLVQISGQNGENQREHAYRFGVNLILYALTGNYKDDQMHIPFILERLDH